jgi:protein tyrosine phosphatase (PTP) superfamily phosphohydrolase (DUF442 family)
MNPPANNHLADASQSRPPEIKWVETGFLARSYRPCYWDDPTPSLVQIWLDEVARLEIKSILCLLSQTELEKFYGSQGIDLLAMYRKQGITVGHVPVADWKQPPLSAAEKKSLRAAFQKLPKPCLIHCSAGVDRTGAAVQFIGEHRNNFVERKAGKPRKSAKRE